MNINSKYNEPEPIKPVKFSMSSSMPIEAVLVMVNSALKYHGLEILFTRTGLLDNSFNGHSEIVCFLDKIYETNPGLEQILPPYAQSFSADDFKVVRDSMRIKKQEKPITEKDFKPIPIPDRELTYEEKVRWFVSKHHEDGMELKIMLDSMRDDNLDNFYWHKSKVEFPKMLSEIQKDKKV